MPAREGAAVSLHDRVINHIYASSLALAGILNRPGIDDAVAERLRSVIEGLDAAIAELRNAAIVGLAERRDAQEAASDGAGEGRRRLCRFSADEVFAYAVNSYDFFRAADHTLWAHESDGLLLSARSGVPIARRDGKVFYDVETALPLYYEDQSHTGASETGFAQKF